MNVDEILDFLRIDKDRIDLERMVINSDDKGLQTVEIVYTDIKTKRLSRCIIGINGVDRPDVPITSDTTNNITSGLN